MVVDEFLVNRHRVAPAAERLLDEFAVRLASAPRRRSTRLHRPLTRRAVGGHPLAGGRICRPQVGGHPFAGGGIWRRPPPRRATRCPDRDSGGLQVPLDRLSIDTDARVDAPHGPPESAQRHHLLLLLIAQDVHPRRGTTVPLPRQRPGALPLVVDFQVSLSGGLCPSTEDVDLP